MIGIGGGIILSRWFGFGLGNLKESQRFQLFIFVNSVFRVATGFCWLGGGEIPNEACLFDPGRALIGGTLVPITEVASFPSPVLNNYIPVGGAVHRIY